MEISVGFADKDRDYIKEGYRQDESLIGNVYIPTNGVDIVGPIKIRYERRPWIEQFEIDGIKPLRPKRTGCGSKSIRAFVQSLNTIYARAYDDYTICSDTSDYFKRVTKFFIQEYLDDEHRKTFTKFCGYVENLWREGTKEIHDVTMGIVLPLIMNNAQAKEVLQSTITEEFREYIGEYYGN